ncbi:MAG: hypothetical protein ACE15D_10225 [Candidatus Eisenbacteria bacterium]|nr:hypothetical protein [Candidatus Eisenbacteria bacterium]
MSPRTEEEIQRSYKLHLILWIAFVIAILTYVGVAFFFVSQRRTPVLDVSTIRTLTVVFYVAGFGLFFFALFWRRPRYSPYGGGGTAGQPMPTQPGGATGMPPVYGTTPAPIVPVLLVKWAIMEAVAILGLVLVALAGPFNEAFPLMIVGLVGLLRHRPTVGLIRDELSRA